MSTAATVFVCALMLLTIPFLFFSLGTWGRAMRHDHVDLHALKDWRRTGFTIMGIFQILVTLVLVVGAIQREDSGPLATGGYAPAVLGIAMIILPRLRIAGAAQDGDNGGA